MTHARHKRFRSVPENTRANSIRGGDKGRGGRYRPDREGLPSSCHEVGTFINTVGTEAQAELLFKSCFIRCWDATVAKCERNVLNAVPWYHCANCPSSIHHHLVPGPDRTPAMPAGATIVYWALFDWCSLANRQDWTFDDNAFRQHE